MLPRIHLIRHGETPWSLSGQHTGLTDIALSERGEAEARRLGEFMRGLKFARVFTSPLARAHRTCELVGFGEGAVVEPQLVEWNYGRFEGLKSAEIRAERPGWNVFLHGCPGGESPPQLSARCDRVIAMLRDRAAPEGDVAIFSHGHFLRALAARWVGLPVSDGQRFILGTASLSILGFQHANAAEPVIVLWNAGLGEIFDRLNRVP